MKFFYRFINAKVQDRVSSIVQEMEDIKTLQKKKNFESSYPIGMIVIARSNEWDDLVIGKIIGYDDDKQGNHITVIVDDFISNSEVSPMGIIREYSSDLLNLLLKHNPFEQWLLLSRYDTKIMVKNYPGQSLKSADEILSIVDKKLNAA